MKLLRQRSVPQTQVRADEAQQLQREDRKGHEDEHEEALALQRRGFFLALVLGLDHAALEDRAAEEE